MNTTLRIRPATPEDAPALARLNAVFNGSSESYERLAVRLSDPRRVETPLLAEIDGQVVGFAALRVVPSVFYPSPYAELTELYVEPQYQRRGVGRALVLYAERLAREAGADELVLLTGFDNLTAQAFYRSLGYETHDLAFNKLLSD